MTPSAAHVIDALRRQDRLLERPQLEWLAREVAGQPELWRPHLDPAATERTYAALHRDEDLDVWALFWLPENDTGWHDHDTSSGAVHVVEGELAEHALSVAGPDRHRTYAAGATFSFGPSHIHRLTCQVPRAVSVHVYSPPLWRLGQYAVSDDGVLSRQSVTYADELRPVAV